MAKRSKEWNESLSKDLKNWKFAQSFLLPCLEEGISLQVALRKVILSIGLKEFAKKAKMEGPNILRAVNTHHNPTQDTLNRLLKPFSLKLAVSPISERHSKQSA